MMLPIVARVRPGRTAEPGRPAARRVSSRRVFVPARTRVCILSVWIGMLIVTKTGAGPARFLLAPEGDHAGAGPWPARHARLGLLRRRREAREPGAEELAGLRDIARRGLQRCAYPGGWVGVGPGQPDGPRLAHAVGRVSLRQFSLGRIGPSRGPVRGRRQVRDPRIHAPQADHDQGRAGCDVAGERPGTGRTLLTGRGGAQPVQQQTEYYGGQDPEFDVYAVSTGARPLLLRCRPSQAPRGRDVGGPDHLGFGRLHPRQPQPDRRSSAAASPRRSWSPGTAPSPCPAASRWLPPPARAPTRCRPRPATVDSPVRTVKLVRLIRVDVQTDGAYRSAPQHGGERLADVLHLLHLHEAGRAVSVLQGAARGRRDDGAPEAHPLGLGETARQRGDAADLAGQADFADRHHAARHAQVRRPNWPARPPPPGPPKARVSRTPPTVAA